MISAANLETGDWEKLETFFFFTAQGHVNPKWLVRSGRNLNPSNISCLSLLPVSLIKIEFIVTEKKWRHHFLHYKSMEKFLHSRAVTPKWINWSGPNSISFDLLCLSLLPASSTKIQSKVTAKSWRHHFFYRSRACNLKMTVQRRPKFELVRDFMLVLLTCKVDEDWIHSNWEKMETPFSPFKIHGNAQGRITPQWKVLPGPISNSSEILCLYLLPASLTKIHLKMTEKTRGNGFIHYNVNGSFLRDFVLPW